MARMLRCQECDGYGHRILWDAGQPFGSQAQSVRCQCCRGLGIVTKEVADSWQHYLEIMDQQYGGTS
jgi:DnaJ-class molecular chaperone